MTPAAFAARVVGVPWKRWHSGWTACDCFGLCVLYYREVLGIDLGPVPETDIASGFSAATGWHECEPMPGACGFMAWVDGSPAHCGVLIDAGHVLHAQEGYPRPDAGSVRVTRLDAMRRLYPDLRFYRYAPCT